MNDAQAFLVTERLELWRPAAGDGPALCRLIADETTRRFLGPASPEPQAQFDRLMRTAGGWALHGYSSFFVRPRGCEEVIASLGVFPSYRGFGKGMDDVPEAGWIVRADWVGQGIAREGMEAVLAWFDATHGRRRIACMIEEGNAASEAVAARLGFTRYDSQDLADPEPVTLGLYARF